MENEGAARFKFEGRYMNDISRRRRRLMAWTKRMYIGPGKANSPRHSVAQLAHLPYFSRHMQYNTHVKILPRGAHFKIAFIFTFPPQIDSSINRRALFIEEIK